jgi:hypothetical protein
MCMSKAKTLKVRKAGRYLWRDAAGRSQGIIIRDPIVKPKGVSVGSIRRAVEKTSNCKRGRSAYQRLK